MKRLTSVAVITALAAVGPVIAAEEADKIVVTASRTAETVDETLASVTVITRDDIERARTSDIVELLRSQGGVDITRTGGVGQQTSVYLRGTESDHVLVLVDGVRAASATTGIFAWQTLDPAQIERIEIVRGPRASLYGSDAIGGVIQIFTRREAGLNVAAEGGSFNTRGARASVGVGDRHRLYASASTRRTDGYSATNPGAGSFYDPDDDGSAQQTINAALDSRLNDRLRLELSLWQAAQQTDFDPVDSQSESDNRVVAAKVHHDLTDSWRQTLQFGETRDEMLTFGRGTFPYTSDITTRRTTVDWQHNIALGSDAMMAAGFSYIDDRGTDVDLLSGTLNYDRSTRTNALYASGQLRRDAHDLQLSARADDHSAFGTHGSGQLAWGWALGKPWRSVLSYGSGFKAPTLNELYSPGYSGFYAGNPDLQPEQSRSAEWSLRRHGGASDARASLYYTRVTDLIASEGVNNQAINIDEATIRGAEIEFGLRRGAWNTKAQFTLQKAVNEQTDTDLKRRPRRKAALNLNYRFAPRTHAGVEVVVASEHQDTDNVTYQTISVPGYAVMNLVGAIQVMRGLSVELRCDNVFDEEYELASGFNPSPRAGYLSLRYTTAP